MFLIVLWIKIIVQALYGPLSQFTACIFTATKNNWKWIVSIVTGKVMSFVSPFYIQNWTSARYQNMVQPIWKEKAVYHILFSKISVELNSF